VSTAFRVVLALVVVALLAPAAAPAAKADLWATVNVCDTLRKPDRIGIRGSMPGTGKDGEMFMRFRVQFFAGTRGWRTVRDSDADSGFLSAGSSRFKIRQTGATFHFPPPTGGAFRMRGMVDFEWRAKGRVVKAARRYTESGHKSVSGADPKNFSAAECRIEAGP
jgi:hypothetical protein